jgi:hypothetical protein
MEVGASQRRSQATRGGRQSRRPTGDRHHFLVGCRRDGPSERVAKQRGPDMGDKSPKSKNKDKKQQDAAKDKKSADMKAKQAAKSTK